MIGQIHNENCISTMARMPDGYLDMTLCSPPYDDLRVYKGYSFDAQATAESLFRVTKDGGVVIWVVGDRTKDGDESGTSFRHALTFKEVGFKLWDTMIFAKTNSFPGDIGPRYRQMFEYMFCFVKGNKPKTFNPIQIPTANPGQTLNYARLEREGRRFLNGRSGAITVRDTRDSGNIFTYVVGATVGGRQDVEQFKHPAVFPLQLALDQISTWSNEGDIVYDCFMGSGTTAIAAVKLGRKYLGSEISSEYAELARERIRRETELPLLDAPPANATDATAQETVAPFN